MSFNYYRHNPGWGTHQFQLGAPPLPGYQPQPSWTGLDFYSAHAMGADPYLYQSTISRMSSGMMGGVGKYEAREWHRRAYAGLGEVSHMMPQEIGIAAAYEAYRQIKYSTNVYHHLYTDYERQREAMRGLAIAEAQRLWYDSGRGMDQYGIQMACDAAAATAARIATEREMEEGQGYGAGQPQQPAFSSSDSDVDAEHGTSPFQKATPGELDHAASLRITRDRTPDPNGLPSLLPGMNDIPGRVLEEEDDSIGSTEHDAKLVAPDASEKEVARSEHDRIADLERQLSETLAERAQLTDQLAERRALLEQAEANVAQAKKRAHDLQAKVDELLLSRDKAEANAAQVKKRAGSEQRELQAKFDELLLSRDQALEQAQSASQKELTEVHAKLEASESELAAVRLRLTDAEVGWAKSKAEADTLLAGTQAGAGLVNMDLDRVMRRLMERVRSVEAEMASLRGNEKSILEMECRNEG